MAAKRLAVFDPSGRLLTELRRAADAVGVTLIAVKANEQPPPCAAVLVAPLAAADLGPPPTESAPRWIVGDGSNAARVASAAAQAIASGVLLTPVSDGALYAVAHTDPTAPEVDLARARALIATSLVDLTGAARDTLIAVAEGFAAHDCIVWWRDGDQMAPLSAREAPTEAYRSQVAGAARIAAAAAGTVITSSANPRSVIACPLHSRPNEVAGLVAIISDSGRRFSASERTDLKAIAARLTRELTWLTSHRRLVAEGERLLAASLHDPLTGAMTRGAFEQAITHEIAAATRRKETVTLLVVDVVGMRRINLQHGHRAGDEVIAQVAQRTRATVRGNDPIGRLGGDEIAVLLVGASADQARIVVDKLIPKLQTEAIKVDDTTDVLVSVRLVASEIAAGERSGEAAFARCYSALRKAPAGELFVVAPDARIDPGAGADTGALSAGTVVGGTYRVVHELSRGAMGVVYRGEDLGLGRPVAIKVLRTDLASDRELVARFRAEAGILASLHHPNLVQVYALGEHGGDVYFVMELVEGQPLSEVLRAQIDRKEWFPTAAIAQIVLEISDALDAMHNHGVIHRDVKPANVLLDRERDRAVLVDVGVAVRSGDQRDAAGTPGYAAPESFTDQTHAATTDVYGLAATVYCMLAGKPPFGSGQAAAVVQRQLHDPLVPPSQLRPGISSAVDDVMRKALDPKPKKRWASAGTFAIALVRALERPADDRGQERAAPPPPRTMSREIKLPSVDAQVEALLSPASSFESPAVAATRALASDAARPRAISGAVRAAHLRVLSRILQHHLGDSGLAKLIEQAPQLATALTPTLPPLGWVDLATLVEALDRARRAVPSQVLPRKIGRNTMEATFARLFGADPSSLPVETVLAALPTFWPRYHDWGDVTVAILPSACEVALAGYSGSSDVCAIVGAELERIVELTGATAVGAIHPRCACSGGARCEFRISWAPK